VRACARFDLPFLLLYRLDRETGRYRLLVHYGVEAGLPATPLDMGADASSPRPFADALQARRIVDVRNVRSMLQGETCGPYDEAPDGVCRGAGARAYRPDQRGVKFKLDEKLSPSLAEVFTAAGHDAHSVAQQALGANRTLVSSRSAAASSGPS
jgi:hypothetical protein